jgi:hypothetical protein
MRHLLTLLATLLYKTVSVFPFSIYTRTVNCGHKVHVTAISVTGFTGGYSYAHLLLSVLLKISDYRINAILKGNAFNTVLPPEFYALVMPADDHQKTHTKTLSE